MKFGQVAGNKSINETIYRCFRFIDDDEQVRFVRRFKEQPHDNSQVMHTFRELILGAFLSENGYRVRSDYRLQSTTPDWCILDDRAHPECIVELVNFHPDAQTSADIVRQIEERGIWCNFVRPNTQRLYYAIREKASKYKDVAAKNNIGYIVSVFGEFDANVEEEELNECLFDKETGLFKLYPEVSGVLFFEESGGRYLFTYKANGYADRTMNIGGGWFYKSN